MFIQLWLQHKFADPDNVANCCQSIPNKTCAVQVIDPVLRHWQALKIALTACTDQDLVSIHALRCALAAWRATLVVPPQQLLSSAQPLADILLSQISEPGWVKVNFPMGLLLAAMLCTVRCVVWYKVPKCLRTSTRSKTALSATNCA